MPTNHQPTPKHPFDRWRGESEKANRAFRDYALMGEGRSLRALLERYRAQYEAWKRDPAKHKKPPTRTWSTLTSWSVKFAWQERVRRWEQIVREEEKAAARRLAEEWANHRRTLIEGAFTKVAQALAAFDPEAEDMRPRLGELIAAVKGVVAELRVEYGETEEQRLAGVVGAAGTTVPPVVFVLGDTAEPLVPEWAQDANPPPVEEVVADIVAEDKD